MILLYTLLFIIISTIICTAYSSNKVVYDDDDVSDFELPNKKRKVIKSSNFQFSIDYKNSNKEKSILMLHGFNDYHYNDELFEHLSKTKNVYALTLRNYAHNLSKAYYYVSDFKEYFVELDYVFQNHQIDEVLAHSTGCLILLIYLYFHNVQLDRIIFNSPFLEWKDSHYILKNPLIYIISWLFPYSKLVNEIVPPIKDEQYYYNPENSPIDKKVNPRFDELGNEVMPYILTHSPIYVRWVSNVTWYQSLIRKLRLTIPITVLCTPEDSILNYHDIVYYSMKLSTNVSVYTFPKEYHNVLVSKNMSLILNLVRL